MKKQYFIFVLTAVLLSSCSGQSITSILSPTEPPVEVSSQILNPDKNYGIITGVLLFNNNGQKVTKENVPLFLAEILADENGVPRVASINRTGSPRTATDSKGQFIFSEVPPGNYGIVLDIVVKAYLLPKPDTEEDLIISVSAGEVIDLGTLAYNASILPGVNNE
jgi:hypothetical protein